MLRCAPSKDVWATGMSAVHVIPSGSEGSCSALAREKLEARSLAAARDDMKGRLSSDWRAEGPCGTQHDKKGFFRSLLWVGQKMASHLVRHKYRG